MEIAYVDNHLLAVDKPAGIPSQPDSSGDESVVEWVIEYIRRRYNKPGNVYAALLHRLDRPTSGALMLARTSKAASRMAELFRQRHVDKTYLAMVSAARSFPPNGTLTHRLTTLPNGSMAVAAARDKKTGAYKDAVLHYQTVASRKGRALLRIRLETGVKHQIRCQLAAVGLPVIGDHRYGGFGEVARPEKVYGGRAILLHAHRLAFVHPVKQVPLTIEAGLPDYWRPFMGDWSLPEYDRTDG